MPLFKRHEIKYLCEASYVSQRGQRAMTLRYVEGDSVVAVAAQMKTTANAVRKLLQSAWLKIDTNDWPDEEAGWAEEAVDRADDPEPRESDREHALGLCQAIGDRNLSLDDVYRVIEDLRALREWEQAHPFAALEKVAVDGFLGRRIDRVGSGRESRNATA